MQRLFHSYNKNLSSRLNLKNARPLAFASLLCCLLANLGQPAAAQNETVWHLKQLHRSLGKVDLFVNPKFVRIETGKADFVVLYRRDTEKVYEMSPAKRTIYVSSSDLFLRHGFLITRTSLMNSKRCRTVLKGRDNCLGQPADVFDVLAERQSASGKKSEVNCAELKTLALKDDFKRMGMLIETIYGMPLSNSIPVQMKLHFNPVGGSLWFRSSENEMKHPPKQDAFYRLRTETIAVEKVPAKLFDAPTGFKVMASPEAVFNSSDAGADLAKMLMP